MKDNDPQELLEFPCCYEFKAVGPAGDPFRLGIVAAVAKHADFPGDAVRFRPSGRGTYQSVSVLVTLYNFQQLTDIYAEMKKTPELKILL